MLVQQFVKIAGANIGQISTLGVGQAMWACGQYGNLQSGQDVGPRVLNYSVVVAAGVEELKFV